MSKGIKTVLARRPCGHTNPLCNAVLCGIDHYARTFVRPGSEQHARRRELNAAHRHRAA